MTDVGYWPVKKDKVNIAKVQVVGSPPVQTHLRHGRLNNQFSSVLRLYIPPLHILSRGFEGLKEYIKESSDISGALW